MIPNKLVIYVIVEVRSRRRHFNISNEIGSEGLRLNLTK